MKYRKLNGLSRNHTNYMRLWRLHRKMKPPQNVSESVRKLNPHIYGPTSSTNGLGAVQEPKRQQDKVPALVKGKVDKRTGKGKLGVIVTLISCRSKLLDDDNLAYSLKGLRDAVSHSIGLDDGDRRIQFQYGQVQTRGEQGTIVAIETL